jgi:uncharacterized protein YbaA (DUF1428 family)
MTGFGRYPFGTNAFGKPQKPKVFVSYHHDNDQAYYDRFSELFGDVYDLVTNRSVDRILGSDDADYQRNRIRDEYITGTSLTIVLCGAESHKRKFIDWEICATLNKEHGLLGIALPTARRTPDGKVIVPGRLVDNVQSGFAHFVSWTEDPNQAKAAIDTALQKAANKQRIANSRETMKRNEA